MNKDITNIKSGKEMLDDFFEEIEQMTEINQDLAVILKNLYKDNKFTNTNISNALSDLQKEEEK